MESVIASLAHARELLGLTQAQVAEAADVRPDYISRLESGGRGNPSLHVLERWAARVGQRIVVVPETAAAPVEVAALPDELRELVLRLAHALPAVAAADPKAVRQLRNLVNDYEDDLRGLEVASATSHVSRAQNS